MEEQQETKWICGFWRRIGALIVDLLILSGVGFVLGLALEDWFLSIGNWGRLVGFTVAILYFGILNSKFARGQTPGKRLLSIRVVNADNSYISLPRSFARYVVLGAPFFLNNINITGDEPAFLIYPLAIIVFGGILSLVYLYIANRVTRQSLHDLVVGTYVVNADAEKQDVGPVCKGHYVVVAIIFIASALAPAFTMQFSNDSPFKEMLSIHRELMKDPAIRFANVSVGETIHSGSSEQASKTRHVTVTATLNKDLLDDSNFAKKIAEKVVAEYPQAKNVDVIRVIFVYGYDIGIWSQWYSKSYDYKPSGSGLERCEKNGLETEARV